MIEKKLSKEKKSVCINIIDDGPVLMLIINKNLKFDEMQCPIRPRFMNTDWSSPPKISHYFLISSILPPISIKLFLNVVYRNRRSRKFGEKKLQYYVVCVRVLPNMCVTFVCYTT